MPRPDEAHGESDDSDSERLEIHIPEAAEAGTELPGFPPDEIAGVSTKELTGFRIIGGDDGGVFQIDSETGKIAVRNSDALDFETAPVRRLEVAMQRKSVSEVERSLEQQFLESIEESGASVTDFVPQLRVHANVTLWLFTDDVNETHKLAGHVLTVPENCFHGHSAGRIRVDDPDADGKFQFELLSQSPSDAFAVDEQSGEITVEDPAAINFESCSEFHCLVRVRDQHGLSVTEKVIIRLVDINEAPDLKSGSWTLHPGTDQAFRIAATDPDCDDILIYRLLVDPTNGAFDLDPVSGDLILIDPSLLAKASGDGCTLLLQAEDKSGALSVGSVRVEWTPQNVQSQGIAAAIPDGNLSIGPGAWPAGTRRTSRFFAIFVATITAIFAIAFWEKKRRRSIKSIDWDAARPSEPVHPDADVNAFREQVESLRNEVKRNHIEANRIVLEKDSQIRELRLQITELSALLAEKVEAEQVEAEHNYEPGMPISADDGQFSSRSEPSYADSYQPDLLKTQMETAEFVMPPSEREYDSADHSSSDSDLMDIREQLAGLFSLTQAAHKTDPSKLNSAAADQESHEDSVTAYLQKLLNPGGTASLGSESPQGSAETDRRGNDRRQYNDPSRPPELDRRKGSRRAVDVESLRKDMNSFRNVSRQSTEFALAAHSFRKVRNRLLVRRAILISLLFVAVAVWSGRISQVMTNQLLVWSLTGTLLFI
ncbi:MAG: cadherin repeat domain-containing protein, partial [Planctomycetaceae bacterium]|nr:cadherin repeat domain-containing protein [Planctomycetaceae bacterium]